MVLLFANGDIVEYSWLAPYLAAATAIIGVDGGTNHIIKAGARPSTLIGDFDSLDSTVLAQFKREGIPIHQFSTAKDETDLELALLFVAEQSNWEKKEILVFGVIGGRLDQTLANIMLLAHPLLHNRTVKLMSQYQTSWLITDQGQVHGRVGDTVSLIPLGGDVIINYTKNLRWDLRQEPLRFGPARGVSNELLAETAEIHISAGQLLCIHTKQSWRR